jgi:hypothetical protein
MLKFLFGEDKPVYDPALGDSLGTAILDEARQGKFDTLFKKVELLRTGEWDRRAFYIDLAGKQSANVQRLETLSDTPLGNLLRGSMAIELAWKARGHGDAVTVTNDGRKLFFKYLNFAGKYLSRAAEQDVEDPTPYAFLQSVAMGQGLERKTADAWLSEATRRDPANQQAHFRRMMSLCAKWYGSHEEMYAFARGAMEKAPADSTLHSIMYLAFQEHYLFLLAFDKNPIGAQMFLRDAGVRRESIAVYQKSLHRRISVERVSDYWPHNLAVWWFMMLKMHEVVRQEVKKVGTHFTEYPWKIFYTDPAAGYQKALNF